MRVLAIETTERLGSVAVGDENNVFDCKDLDSSQRSAESLAPGIRSVLETVEWTPQEIDLVAVTVGPGSFTGLRVGITTAKMFCLRGRGGNSRSRHPRGYRFPCSGRG